MNEIKELNKLTFADLALMANIKMWELNKEKRDITSWILTKEETFLVKVMEDYLLNRLSTLLFKVTGKEFIHNPSFQISHGKHTNYSVNYYNSKFLMEKDIDKESNKINIVIPNIMRLNQWNLRWNGLDVKYNILLEITDFEPTYIVLRKNDKVEKIDNIFKLFDSEIDWKKAFTPNLYRVSSRKLCWFEKDFLDSSDGEIKEMLKNLWEDYSEGKKNTAGYSGYIEVLNFPILHPLIVSN